MTADIATPRPWTVVAQNLAEHAGNAIHTDDGARLAGFPAALVAGVTTYAYLTHPIAAAWGEDWLAGGRAEVRFRAPVFAGDSVTCATAADPADPTRATVEAVVPRESGARAVLLAWRDAGPPPEPRSGERLASRQITLSDRYGASYGRRAGDDLDVYERQGIVHPAVWPSLANNVVHTDLARGSWIHTRSRIAHHALARDGATADVHATVVERFERSGERAILDVVIEVDGVVVATLEHEAIIALPGN
jgi:acyl dehydratase